MIHNIRVTNYRGQRIVFDLSNPLEGDYIIEYANGLDSEATNLYMTDIAGYDGNKFASANTPGKNIILGFSPFDEDIENARHYAYSVLTPKKPVLIEIDTDYRTLNIAGFVESLETDIFKERVTYQVSIRCESPYFKSGDIASLTQTLFFDRIAEFEFPFSNNDLYNKLLQFGSLTETPLRTITYKGDVEAGVNIRIKMLVDKVGKVEISNDTYDEHFKLDFSKLTVGSNKGSLKDDEFILVTKDGIKSLTILRWGETYNVLYIVDTTSDWINLYPGDNTIAFQSDQGVRSVSLVVDHDVLFLGV